MGNGLERQPRGWEATHSHQGPNQLAKQVQTLIYSHAVEATAFTQINQAMEALVLTCPQQYLWGYARYKAPRKEAA